MPHMDVNVTKHGVLLEAIHLVDLQQTTFEQRCTNFPEICEPSQKF